MSLTDKLYEIDQLQQTIGGYGKLPEDILKKINYKFRLEWNYNSNSMEGNSLTRSETRSVMINNITVEGKPIRDVLEMRQHDEVITSILKMGKGELGISEKRIKEIHAGIIFEEDSEKIKLIGQWKKTANHLINYKKEKFDFVEPAGVPEKMHQLVNWLNTQKEKIDKGDKTALHPALIAFKFHLDYLTIHPFYDGNGRTARILSNIILIAYGYPPVYIKIEEKDTYYRYLADIQAYGGDPGPFYEFMAGLLIRSQNIVLNAIQGMDIEDPDDLDKKIFLLELQQEALGAENEVPLQISKEVFIKIYETWLEELLDKTNVVVIKFNKFFKETNHFINIQIENGHPIEIPYEEKVRIIPRFTSLAENFWAKSNPQYISIIFKANYEHSKKGGFDAFNCNYNLEIRFRRNNYEVYIDDPAIGIIINSKPRQFTKKLLHQMLTERETEEIVKKFSDTIYRHIEYHIKQLGLR